MASLHITDASGRQWQHSLSPQNLCTIGRAPDNIIVLNDPLVSRYHAHVVCADSTFHVVDGVAVGGQIKRSANKVFVNGKPQENWPLVHGDTVAIGKSVLRFDHPRSTSGVNYNDTRLGHTQVAISLHEVIEDAVNTGGRAGGVHHPAALSTELAALRRKAEMLALLYEMSKTLSSVFDLYTIFEKACDIIFRVTPADRVVALVCNQEFDQHSLDGGVQAVALRARDDSLLTEAKTTTIGRTITRKVIRERVALLSQDAASDSQFSNVKSIIAQGVRSTICAPLLTESGVYGALYADRLDPYEVFTRDDLELLSAIASQAAVAVESVRAHERLAREEVARANYSRFLPEYVVRQMLDHPETFRLGGSNQPITVLFADVRGFTRMAEHATPERIVQLLNRYFTAMTEIIFAHGGTLDKYIGDGLMALFGAPTATPDDAARAIMSAATMQNRMLSLNAELRAEGLPEIGIGIGLHTGEATVGYIGSERRTEYTAIGDTVNLAARLESNAKGGQILISEAAAQAANTHRHPLHPHPALTVKNRVQPVPLFEVDWRHENEDWIERSEVP
ncbi:MAG: adenylate/guanylate cyclase domain-containing protein [Pyrinomonadaceae bacterium]